MGTASAASFAPAQARRKKDFRYAPSRVFSSRCSHWSRRSALQSIMFTLQRQIIGKRINYINEDYMIKRPDEMNACNKEQLII